MIMDMKICLKRGSPIVEYGGAICKTSPSQHQAQVECARQRFALDRFSLLQVSCVSWRSGYRIVVVLSRGALE
jgi:hypothetical protein